MDTAALWLLSLVPAGFGVYFLFLGPTRSVEALLLFLIAAVLMVGASVVYAVDEDRRKITEAVDRTWTHRYR